jgi:hypothetical protein
VTLNGNMNCSAKVHGAALFIGKNGITINLNGFTITGNGSDAGVDNQGDWPASAPGAGGVAGPGTGFNNDTVENGNVTSSLYGVYVNDTKGMKVSKVSVYGTVCDALWLTSSNTASVSRSHFGTKSHPTNCDGAFMADNTAVTISDSTFNWNGSYYGIYDQDSQATLTGVTANHNNSSGIFIDSPVGPYLIDNSTADGNGGDGFHVSSNSLGTIKFTGNTAENNNGWGFWAFVHAKGTNNGYKNDPSGGCFQVGGCHLNP